MTIPVANQFVGRRRKPWRCNPFDAIRTTQAKVYSFRDVAARAKLFGFRGILQFTEGLRIVICLPAMRSGRACGGRTFTSQGTNEKRQQVANKLKFAPSSAQTKTRKSHVWAFKMGHDQAQESGHRRQARPRFYPRHPRNHY